MAAPKIKDRCSTCLFYLASESRGVPSLGYVPKGKCRRFPAEQPKEPADWCGEYKRG